MSTPDATQSTTPAAAHPTPPSPAQPSPAQPSPVPPSASGVAAIVARHPVGVALALLAAALALCLLGYLALAVPGSWFPSAASRTWAATEFALTRGVGVIHDGELVVQAPDATGTVLVTLNTDFRSSDYRAIAWIATGVPDDADVRLLWRTDYAPAKLNSAPVAIAAGRLRPLTLAGDPAWVGRITGLALSVRGALAQPVRLRGVAAKPLGAPEILGDRYREWTAFEGWSGTSITLVTGGADIQNLPLPALLAAAMALAALVAFVALRGRARAAFPMLAASMFVAAWLLLDARWTWDLVRQVRDTGERYAGKDWRERHLAAEDGSLFAFVDKAKAKLPATPARVFVAADAHYFRNRGAYHLYPHNVWFDPYANTFPPANVLRPGDYVVVYQRRGMQFDPGARRLRWDGGPPLDAELLLAESGGALFRIR